MFDLNYGSTRLQTQDNVEGRASHVKKERECTGIPLSTEDVELQSVIVIC